MENPFKLEYEDKIRETFPSYSETELKDFVARALSERVLLILSLSNDSKNPQREMMLGVLERLQEQAINELKRR